MSELWNVWICETYEYVKCLLIEMSETCVVFFHLLISHDGGAFVPLTVSKIGSNKISVKGKRRKPTLGANN